MEDLDGRSGDRGGGVGGGRARAVAIILEFFDAAAVDVKRDVELCERGWRDHGDRLFVQRIDVGHVGLVDNRYDRDTGK